MADSSMHSSEIENSDIEDDEIYDNVTKAYSYDMVEFQAPPSKFQSEDISDYDAQKAHRYVNHSIGESSEEPQPIYVAHKPDPALARHLSVSSTKSTSVPPAVPSRDSKQRPPSSLEESAQATEGQKQNGATIAPTASSANSVPVAIPSTNAGASSATLISKAAHENDAWYMGKISVADLGDKVLNSPHETFGVIRTEDNQKYVIVISDHGRLAIFSVLCLDKGRVQSVEDGVVYPSLARLIQTLRYNGLVVGSGNRLKPLHPLHAAFFHRSAVFEICKKNNFTAADVRKHVWFWRGDKEAGESAVAAGEVGTFIVRLSSDPSKFVLVCNVTGEGRSGLVRFQIKWNGEHYTFADASHESLTGIIQHMRLYTIQNPDKASRDSAPTIKLGEKLVKGVVMHRSAFRALVKVKSKS